MKLSFPRTTSAWGCLKGSAPRASFQIKKNIKYGKVWGDSDTSLSSPMQYVELALIVCVRATYMWLPSSVLTETYFVADKYEYCRYFKN